MHLFCATSVLLIETEYALFPQRTMGRIYMYPTMDLGDYFHDPT